ncbi:MAG TPA: hypothetical protein VGN97_05850 [Mesorhizobium sp.]|jgi:capsid protein|nr:hypothetical protein [Mesorhizobium sp.]
MTRPLAALLALATAVGAGVPAPAFSADLIVRDYETGICAEEKWQKKIRKRFSYQVEHVPNLPDVEILDFRNIRETRFEPTDERHPISRRYCAGDVVLSDGNTRDIWFLIETDMGFASIGDNVEFCVAGFDRWRVYNGHCRVLR